MDDLLDAFGPNRAMALCRELTKDYEEIRRGMVGTIRQGVVDNPPRGEMVLVIGGASDEEAEAAAPATLSIDDLAVLAIDRAWRMACASKTRSRRWSPNIRCRMARCRTASRCIRPFWQ